MMRKSSISFLLLAAPSCGAGCGTSDEATRRTIVGPKVAGSVRHGLAVAAVSTDQSLPTSRFVPYAALLIPKPKP